MATLLNTLYPPIIDTYMPAFIYNERVKVSFNISDYDDIDNIKYVHVSLRRTDNNENQFVGKDSDEYNVKPTVLILLFTTNEYNKNEPYNQCVWKDTENNNYYFYIWPFMVDYTNEYFQIDKTYKIQIRFDTTPDSVYEKSHTLWENTGTYIYVNKNTAINTYLSEYSSYFSEWSSSCLLKPIKKPSVTINNWCTALNEEENNRTQIYPTDMRIVAKLSSTTETLSQYWFTINGEQIGDKVSTTNTVNENQINTHFDFTGYKPGNGELVLNYITSNGYTGSQSIYYTINDYWANHSIDNCINISNDEDDYTINITLSKDNSTHAIEKGTCYYLIERADSLNDFNNWTVLESKCMDDSEYIYNDISAQSLTGYKYRVTYQFYTVDENDIKTINTVAQPYVSDIIIPKFYGAFFDDADKHLKLEFDFNASNLNPISSITKTDTIGGRYPKFSQNAVLNYKTIPFSGRLSSEDGDNFINRESFFNNEFYQKYYVSGDMDSSFTDSHNDWLWERTYRDEVVKWLNNGNAKLFRTMTEGNLLGIVTNISLSPDQTLGRRLWNISATITEIGDGNNIDDLITYGIIERVDER